MNVHSFQSGGPDKSYPLTFDDHEKYPINFGIADSTFYAFRSGYGAI